MTTQRLRHDMAETSAVESVRGMGLYLGNNSSSMTAQRVLQYDIMEASEVQTVTGMGLDSSQQLSI